MENEITKAYELGFIPNPKDYTHPTFEEILPLAQTKEQIFVKEQKNNGIKVASVCLPKRVLNPEENKTDVNDFFNSLDGLVLSEIKYKNY
jgi:hypothetical protein